MDQKTLEIFQAALAERKKAVLEAEDPHVVAVQMLRKSGYLNENGSIVDEYKIPDEMPIILLGFQHLGDSYKKQAREFIGDIYIYDDSGQLKKITNFLKLEQNCAFSKNQPATFKFESPSVVQRFRKSLRCLGSKRLKILYKKDRN